ncbi:MAG: VanW family protein [Clostridia bacterium]|nr:VanW family protein [Clostridia bacterium]
MLRQMTALILALLLVVTAVPVALAATGSYSAHTPLSGADSDKLNNLRLAAQAIDGTTVAAGGRFSFNDTVGPREKRRGYRTAPNGRGALVTGGGVAQAASTLYMALLQMGEDVDIDPVKTYGARFTDDYVQNPSLAIVTDYDAGIDLSFTSLTGDLSIDMWMDEDDLWCVVTANQSGGQARSSSGSGLSFLDDDGEVSYTGSPYFFDSLPEEDDRVEAVGEDRSIIEGGARLQAADEEDRFIVGDGDIGPAKDGGYDVIVDSLDGDPPLRPQGTATIQCGGDADVVHNVTLAADSLNDTMLDSGDVFSFNDVVGPRTKKYGYRRAVNGRGAKVTGGGVAQVASALWLAIEDLDDIEVVEKSTYGSRYNQRYVSDPADAILTDYASGRDFRFRYTGNTRLTIYAYVEDGRLYCDVFED